MRSTRPILLVCVLLAAAGLVYWLAVAGGGGPRVAGPLPYEQLEREEGPLPSGAPGDTTGDDPAEATGPEAPEDGARTALAPDAPDPAQPEASTVAGRVVDAFGQPVAGATVYVAPADAVGPLGAARLDLLDPRALPWLQRRELHSGPDGRFELALDSASELALAVRAPGYAPLRTTRAARDEGLGDLVLEASPVLTGRVVDAAGRGVSEAELRAGPPPAPGRPAPPWLAPPQALSDAGGAFRLDELPAGPFVIEVSHPEHPPARLEDATERPGETRAGLVIRLPEGGAVRGRVLGLEPGAEAGLAVRARAADEAGFGVGLGRGLRTAPVAAGGAFELRGLPTETDLLVQAVELDAAGRVGAARSAPVAARTGDADIELTLQARLVIEGRVVDAATGAPIPRFELRAGSPWPVSLGAGAAAEHPDGRFRFDDATLEPGTRSVALRVVAEGFAPWEREAVELPANGLLQLGELRLRPVPRLLVRVRDARDESPVAGARVALRLAAEPGGLPVLPGESESSATSGEDGLARLSSRPGERGAIVVRHPGFAPFESDVIDLPAAEADERVVRLTQGAAVLVTVLGRDGEPAPEVAVQHLALDDAVRRTGGMAGSTGPPTRTDEAGQVRYVHLPAGRHAFRVASTPGGAFEFARAPLPGQPLPAGWSERSLSDGGSAELTLRLAARGALEGRVTEGGRPRAGALLELVRAGEGGGALPLAGFGGASARSGADGTYRVEELAAGEYLLRLTHPGRAMPARFELRIEEGANRFDPELPTAVAEGRVTSADGRSLAGALVSVQALGEGDDGPRRPPRGEAGDGTGVETGPDGRFRLEGLPSGVSLQVLARHPDHQPALGEPFVLEEDGAPAELLLVLRPAGALDVRVVREDGSAPAFCRVVARFDGTSDVPVPERRELVPEGGRVLLRGLAPGGWIVSADALSTDPGTEGANEAQPQRAEVVAGETTELELTLP